MPCWGQEDGNRMLAKRTPDPKYNPHYYKKRGDMLMIFVWGYIWVWCVRVRVRLHVHTPHTWRLKQDLGCLLLLLPVILPRDSY